MSSAEVVSRLTNLLAVTDSALTRLDVDDLLLEVLDRLRVIVDADTAAVLLHEAGSDELVARAAVGLEEEVRQGVRIPIGTGFAGSIAAQRRPIFLDRVDRTTVANPILWEKGVRAMLGVPLLQGDDVIGVMHVGRLERRPFEPHDAELLQIAGERVAGAIDNRRLAVEAAAAAMLERGLLPARLPKLEEIEFAARYVPAENRAIGGDWYDTFLLPSGQLWVVVGDVAGHGLNAAVIMGRVKSALRAYALLGDGPARVLELTDHKVEHFEIGTMVTIICAVADPPYDRFVISSAGHPPPVAAAPGGEAELLVLRVDPPLGAVPGTPRHETTVTLPDGGALALYTDGLIERRDEPMDQGLERLRAAFRAADPETLCQELMHQLVGDAIALDDVALLALRRRPGITSVTGTDEAEATARLVGEIRLAPRPTSVPQARAFAVAAAGDVDDDVRSMIELLVSELATNCVVHTGGDFTVAVHRDHARVRVDVTDAGGGRVAVQHAERTDTHGRGLYFVERLSTAWGVEATDPQPGKTVWFTLPLDGSARYGAERKHA